MKTLLKLIGGLLAASVVIAAAAVIYLATAQADLSEFENDYLPSAPAAPGQVTVQNLGNANLLFSDGDTQILIDGWFTRPDIWALLSEIEPDEAAIDAALARAGVKNLAAVIPGHSHFDHAMDSPIVATKTGADLIGSSSTRNIARGLGFDETRFKLVDDEGVFQYGKFIVTVLKSRHLVFGGGPLAGHDLEQDKITEPLVPPVPAAAYKMGGAFSIIIEHPSGTSLVQASAGYVGGLLQGRTVDTVFLGVGAALGQTKPYLDAYWAQVVEMTSAKTVIPIHWDSFTHPLGDTPEPPSLLAEDILGQGAIEGIRWTKAKAADERAFGLLPMWGKVVLP